MYPSLRNHTSLPIRIWQALFLVGLFALLALPAGAQSAPFSVGQFLYNPNNTVNGPRNLHAADLAGNGAMDIVGQISGFPGILVFMNNGSGTFSNPTLYTVGNIISTSVTDFQIVDLTGSGKPSLVVVATDSGSGFLYIFPNNGDGTFGTPTVRPIIGGIPEKIIAEDFNGDGIPDLAVSLGAGVSTFDVLLGDGRGGFQKAVRYGTGNDGEVLVTAVDFTNHGSFDLLSANQSSAFLWHGNGDGTFLPPVPITLPLPTGYSLVTDLIPSFPLLLGDFNYNDNLDLVTLVTANPGTNGPNGGSLVELGNGDATFNFTPGFPNLIDTNDFSGGALDCTFADFNGDGKLDAINSNFSAVQEAQSSTVLFSYGNGDGTFQTAIPFVIPGENQTDPIVADFYNNASPDIALGDFQFQRGLNFDFSGILLLQSTLTTGNLVTSSQNPSLVGNPVTFTATVKSQITGTPTGTVTFFDGQTQLGSVALDNTGHASFTPGFIDIGNHTITAHFDGGTEFGSVFSSPIYQEVFGKSPGPLTLTPSSDPVVQGQPVTLTASLSDTLTPTPTGTMTFYNGATVLGTVALGANNQAVFPTTFAAVGTYTLTAVYSGDRHYTGVTSAPLTEAVISVGSPSISSITPSSAQEGSPNLMVTVQGQALTNSCVVLFNNNAISTTFVDTTHLSAIIPAQDLAEEGSFPVTVSNTTSHLTSPPFTFTVTDAPLTATGTTFEAVANNPYSGPVATFIDGDSSSPASDFAGTTINWGDGIVSPAQVVSNGGGNFTVNGTHTYAAAGTYSVKVSINDVGGSQATANSTATVLAGVPTPPTTLTATALSTSQILLNWGSSLGTPTSYFVERADSSGLFTVIATVNGSTTTYTDSGLQSGTSYNYRVRSINSIGFSPYSNNASATTFTQVLTTFPAGLQMISLPYSYGNTSTDAAQILGTNRIATWNTAATDYLLYPNLPVVGTQTQDGVGYWIDEPQATPFFAAGNAVASPFSEALQPGWNMIGDPFTNPITWTIAQFSVNFIVAKQPPGTKLTLAQMQQANIITQPLFDYNTTIKDYQETTTLQPYLGDWVFVDPNFSNNQPITLWLTNPGS